MATTRWRGGRPALFVAAASSPSEGPSVSRPAAIHPTDALGTRRYEEGIDGDAEIGGPSRGGGAAFPATHFAKLTSCVVSSGHEASFPLGLGKHLGDIARGRYL